MVIVAWCMMQVVFCRDAEAKGPKAVVFVTNYLHRGDLSTKPQGKQVTDTVRVFASPGEYEPATFSIRSGVELKGVRVELAGDLTDNQGSTIRRTAVEIRLVDPFEEWTKKKTECYLLKRDTVDIAANTTRRFWVTVHVPDDAKPGVYGSKILIGKPITKLGPDLGRLMTLKTLTYEVEVLPIQLLTAHETGMAFFMFYDTYYYGDLPDGASRFVTDAYQKRVFDDMREHGMTTANLHLYPFVDGKFTLTGRTEKHLGLAQTMETLKKTKLVAPGLPVTWVGAECYGPDVWKGVLDEGRKRKWPEIVFYAVDEPHDEKKKKQVREIMKRFNTFRAKHPQYGLRVTTALGSSRGIQTVGYHYDLWIGCQAQRIGESGVIADAKMHKKELWTYDCMLAPVDAETDRYYFGVWAWVSGVKGCAHWAYFAQPHLSYVYPTEDELIPTIGWEAVREGIDDYRYLSTLKRLADKARATGKKQLARRADKIFAGVKKMVTMDNYGAAYHKAMASSVKLATAYQRPRVEPNLSIDSYDRMRLKVAKAIADIAAVLSASKSR
jgi:hypothetical protein